MIREDKWTVILLLILAVTLIAGVAHLFIMRFSRGDVYPAYSSLRADPLGTRALYESLDRLRAVRTERVYQAFDRMRGRPGITILVAGLPPGSFTRRSAAETRRHMVQLVESGSRLVIAFAAFDPQTRTGDAAAAAEDCGETCGETEMPETEPAAAGDPPETAMRTLFDDLRWMRNVREETAAEPAVRSESAPSGLPGELNWRGSWSFEVENDSWTVLYESSGLPVVVERRYGKGSMVLCTDSFAFSNEALWRDRETAYLAWLLGDPEQVWFVESHHGLTETIGIMRMMRAFRLHGVLAGLAVLAILFFWQQQMPLLPEATERAPDSGNEGIAGRDAYSGLTALLRRAVPLRSLGRTCVDVWAADRRRYDRSAAETARRLRRHVARHAQDGNPDPVALYKELCKLSQERKNM